MYNSLPWLEKNWTSIKKSLDLKYHSYENIFFQKNMIYVNEGFGPHLTWRNLNPFQAMDTNNNIYLLLHPHWWHINHAFED